MFFNKFFVNGKLRISRFFFYGGIAFSFFTINYLLCQFAVNFVKIFFKIPHAGFAGIGVGNVQKTVFGVLYLIFFQAVFFQTLGHQIPFGDFQFFRINVAGQLNNFHAVQKRLGNRIQRIGGNNKKDVGNIKGKIQVMIPKRRILLRVQHFQQGAGGIALIARPHFINLINHKHRVSGFDDFNSLNDLARHRAYVGSAVALYLRLVAHSADRKAEKLFAQSAGNGFAERGLSDAGRPHQADDRPFGNFVSRGNLGF